MAQDLDRSRHSTPLDYVTFLHTFPGTTHEPAARSASRRRACAAFGSAIAVLNVFPAHPKPFSDESASSWVGRLAQANGLSERDFATLLFQKKQTRIFDWDAIEENEISAVVNRCGNLAKDHGVAQLSIVRGSAIRDRSMGRLAREMAHTCTG